MIEPKGIEAIWTSTAMIDTTAGWNGSIGWRMRASTPGMRTRSIGGMHIAWIGLMSIHTCRGMARW